MKARILVTLLFFSVAMLIALMIAMLYNLATKSPETSRGSALYEGYQQVTLRLLDGREQQAFVRFGTPVKDSEKYNWAEFFIYFVQAPADVPDEFYLFDGQQDGTLNRANLQHYYSAENTPNGESMVLKDFYSVNLVDGVAYAGKETFSARKVEGYATFNSEESKNLYNQAQHLLDQLYKLAQERKNQNARKIAL